MNNKIEPIKIAIILLTLATAVIHIVLAIPEGLKMFYLNGLGYLTLLTAFFLPQLKDQRNIIRWALIVYAGITIIAWIFIGERSQVGIIDKTIEIILIVVLLIDMRRTTSKPAVM